jgi:hypothetical protein
MTAWMAAQGVATSSGGYSRRHFAPVIVGCMYIAVQDMDMLTTHDSNAVQRHTAEHRLGLRAQPSCPRSNKEHDTSMPAAAVAAIHPVRMQLDKAFMRSRAGGATAAKAPKLLPWHHATIESSTHIHARVAWYRQKKLQRTNDLVADNVLEHKGRKQRCNVCSCLQPLCLRACAMTAVPGAAGAAG